MSDPGIFNPQTPMQKPLTMQQVMDFQKQQAMAQALMGNQSPNTQPYAGASNAGGDIMGALLQQRMMNAAQPQYGNADPKPNSALDTFFSKAGGLFNFGGQ